MPAAGQEAAPRFHALVFSKTTGFRHTDAINQGVPAFRQMTEEHDLSVEHTEDAAVFTDADLARFDVLVMFQTSQGPDDPDLWDAAQRAALERYQQAGGGIVAIHNAADVNFYYPWWKELIGTDMPRHAATSPTTGGLEATAQVPDGVHAATAGLPNEWPRRDEWYNWDPNPHGDVHVLATVDEDTYAPGPSGMGADHPISWCRLYDGGRSWVTGMGHFGYHYTDEPLFLDHLLGGLEYAAGVAPEAEAQCGGTVWENFQKVPLTTDVTQPMALDVADDGRVFFAERTGGVRVFRPDSGATVDAGAPQSTAGGRTACRASPWTPTSPTTVGCSCTTPLSARAPGDCRASTSTAT